MSSAGHDRVHIARLQAADAPRYRALMLQAYEHDADAYTTTAEERAAEPDAFWVRRIADPSGLSAAFGAFQGAALVGSVALAFSAKPKTRHKALLIGMYVEPAARGRGIGAALLQAIVDCARAREGVLMLDRTLTEGNEPALRLYRRFGFQAFGVEPMAILTPAGFRGKVQMALALDRGALPRPPAEPAAGRGAGQ